MDTAQNQNSMKLILFDKNQSIKHFGECKLKVDVIEENVITLTLNNGKEVISTFDRKFVKRMNLMGIINDQSKKHMIIIFSSKETCAKICNFIQNNKPAVRIQDSVMEESEFSEKLFSPFLKAIYIEQNQSVELKAVVQNFLNNFDENQIEQKQKYLKLIAEMSLRNPVVSDATSNHGQKNKEILHQVSDENDECIILSDEEEKEGVSLMESINIDLTGEFSNPSMNSINDTTFGNIDDSDFDNEQIGDISDSFVSHNDSILTTTHNMEQEKRYSLRNRTLNLSLFNFGNSDNSEEDAAIDESEFEDDSNGNFESDQGTHVSINDDENYTLNSIRCSSQNQHIRPRNFELYEKQYGERKIKKMNVFVDDERTLVYEYTWYEQSKCYTCTSCLTKFQIRVPAKLQNDEKGEYVELGSKKHLCQPQNSKECIENRVIRPPNFEIFEKQWRGRAIKMLKVFDETNSSFFYIYSWIEQQKAFRCFQCSKKHGKNITAKLGSDEEGEFVKLGSREHQCKLLDSEYLKQNQIIQKPKKCMKNKIIRPPNYEIYEKQCRQKIVKKLKVFNESTSALFYQYSWVEQQNAFRCDQCFKKYQKNIIAKLKSDEEGEFVALSLREHQCQPQREKSADLDSTSTKIIRPPNFELFEKQLGEKQIKKMNVFANEEKTLTYEYTWHENIRCYSCTTCKNKIGVWVSAKLQNDEEGEYVELGSRKHQCEPRNLKNQKTSTIIRPPNFEIYKKQWRERIVKKLKIFNESNLTLFYNYIWIERVKTFRCDDCYTKYRKNITAKLRSDEEGEFVELGRRKHQCEPQKKKLDSNSNKIIRPPNFKLFEKQFGEGKFKKMHVFVDHGKTLIYEYTWNEQSKFYSCSTCQQKFKSYVSAKLQNDEKGEYLQLGNKKHLCFPLNLKNKRKGTIIRSPKYQIYEKQWHGKTIKMLKIFDESIPTLFYKYAWVEQQKAFRCEQCFKKYQKNIIAKLKSDEEGEFVELGRIKHLCSPMPDETKKVLNYRNLNFAKIIQKPHFEISDFFNNRGIQKKCLTIFDKTSKQPIFKYIFDDQANKFVCYECRSMQKYVSAKLLKNGGGEEYVVISNVEHVCNGISQHPSSKNPQIALRHPDIDIS